MIQRKQTLFLLAVIIVDILLFFIPFLSYNVDNSSIALFTILPTQMAPDNIIYPFIIDCLSIIIAFVTIFLFNKRPLQYKMANILALLNVFIVGLFFLLNYNKVGEETKLSYSTGAFLPILSIVCAFLAAHFIKKDEQLVRSTDRIR